MSRKSQHNPHHTVRGTKEGRSVAGRAKQQLKNAGKRYLAGISTEAQYREQYGRLTAIIRDGGLELPDVPLPREGGLR